MAVVDRKMPYLCKQKLKLKEIEDAYKEWLSKLDGQKNIGDELKKEE